eukprot:921908-Amphidinium_carterae.1
MATGNAPTNGRHSKPSPALGLPADCTDERHEIPKIPNFRASSRPPLKSEDSAAHALRPNRHAKHRASRRGSS